MNRRSPSETILSEKRTHVTFPLTSWVLKKTHFVQCKKISRCCIRENKRRDVHRVTYCAIAGGCGESRWR